ncbi:unnamed protein product [Rangifer tarandus platyrhynchus]|uniref:Uncharacterized protein n=2 Tax=Rangifer tarandus platyrhynchus TaxID=3082113 RepID=A0ABN8ZE32_RANTA|nr:unnamed protein product [Rangifer tarandus platyrhynchus]CAI9707390.1 unnamed protein product [Rangifer tarandus platyrhynchus]
MGAAASGHLRGNEATDRRERHSHQPRGARAGGGFSSLPAGEQRAQFSSRAGRQRGLSWENRGGRAHNVPRGQVSQESCRSPADLIPQQFLQAGPIRSRVPGRGDPGASAPGSPNRRDPGAGS